MVLDHLIISFVVLNVVLYLWSVRVGTFLYNSPSEVLQNLEKDLRLRS
jgi:hypothetical protein